MKVRKVSRAGEFSVFLSGEAGSGHVTEVAEKCIFDAKAMGRKACKQIIFGCVGGVFNSADGRRMARVTGCTGTAAGDSIARLHFVHWRTNFGNEERTGVQSGGSADQFFERFPPAGLKVSGGVGGARGGSVAAGRAEQLAAGQDGQATAAGPLQ